MSPAAVIAITITVVLLLLCVFLSGKSVCHCKLAQVFQL